MKSEAIQRVNEKIYRKHIKLQGKKPRVSEVKPGTYLLQYTYDDTLPGGKSLSQTIRVVADEDGNIKKMSCSRG
jgi:hypothetical protein